jgi:exopolysaccharide production protein ExoQ
MDRKTPRARTHILSHGQSRSSNLSLIRDVTVFAYLIVNFTAISIPFSAFSAVEQDLSEGSLFWQILVPSFFGIALLLTIYTRTSFRQVAVIVIPLAPILIWILLSATWSDFPDVTLKRAVRTTMETGTAILLAVAYRDQYRLLRVSYFAFCSIIAIDIALLAMPELSFSPDGYTGVHYHKNDTAIFYLLAFPIFLLAFIDPKIFYLRLVSGSFALCCLVFLVLSQSKTSLPVLPLCLAITFGLISMRRLGAQYPVVIVFVIACITAIVALFITAVGLDNFLSFFVEDLTFSGRTAIWNYTMALFWERPILGQGFGAIWNVGVYSLSQQQILNINFVLKHAHNGFIGILAELGIVGLVLTIGFLFTTLWRLWARISKENVNRINFIAIYALFANCLINTTEVTFFQLGSNLWIYFLLTSSAALSIAFFPERVVELGTKSNQQRTTKFTSIFQKAGS